MATSAQRLLPGWKIPEKRPSSKEHGPGCSHLLDQPCTSGVAETAPVLPGPPPSRPARPGAPYSHGPLSSARAPPAASCRFQVTLFTGALARSAGV